MIFPVARRSRAAIRYFSRYKTPLTFESTMSSMNLTLILLLSYFFTYLVSFHSTWTSTITSLPMRKESSIESYVLAFLAFTRGCLSLPQAEY
jgi:hypothetical protein